MLRQLIAASLCASGLAAAPALFAQESKPAATPQYLHRFSVGFEYANGDYGASSDTSTVSIPFAYRLTTGPWQFGATIPWLSQDGPGNVSRDIGRFGPSGASRSESGFGDLLVSGLRTLNTGSAGFGLDVGMRVKLPTASHSKEPRHGRDGRPLPRRAVCHLGPAQALRHGGLQDPRRPFRHEPGQRVVARPRRDLPPERGCAPA